MRGAVILFAAAVAVSISPFTVHAEVKSTTPLPSFSSCTTELSVTGKTAKVLIEKKVVARYCDARRATKLAKRCANGQVVSTGGRVPSKLASDCTEVLSCCDMSIDESA